MPDLKKLVAGVGAVIVAGVLIWFEAGGKETILNLFKSARIVAHSSSRPTADTFLANEQLVFELKNVKADRVFWVFGESAPVVDGGVDADHVFAFDSDKNHLGFKSFHPVFAIYRDGNAYHSAFTEVSTENVDFHSALAAGSPLGLNGGNANLNPADFRLQAVTLDTIENGVFKPKLTLPLTAEGAANPGLSLKQQVMAAITEKPGGPDILKSLKDKNPWLTFEFKNFSTGQTLTLSKSANQ